MTVTGVDSVTARDNNPRMEKELSRVAAAAKERDNAVRELDRADRAFRRAVLAAYNRGASLRAIRDAGGGTVSHEGVRRIVAREREE